MDVKKSLANANWDVEAAFQDLRKRGLAAVGKKSGRTSAEGLVGLAHGPAGVAFVEVNCETDFVARNEQFQALVSNIAKAALSSRSLLEAKSGAVHEVEIGDLSEAATPEGSVSEALASVAVVVRENIKLRHGFLLPTSESSIAGSYTHKAVQPGLGSMAAAVVLESDKALDPAARTEVAELANQIAMHAVAVKPLFLSRDTVDGAELQKEMDMLRSQVQDSGKPVEIIEKIVSGRMNKYYEDVCLLDQKFVLDEKDGKKVQAHVEAMGKKHKVALRIAGFKRLQVGEGIAREVTDFAAEVKATAGM